MNNLKELLVSALAATLLCVAVPSPARTHDAHQQPTYVLAVGNSFSEDAIDQYFYDLCHAAGKPVVVGDLYIGGCPLSRHLLNARTDSAAYRFRLIDSNGVMHTTSKVSIARALKSEPWTFVSFQQASGISGKYATYSDLAPLLQYTDSVSMAVRGASPSFVWHQTWAYSEDSKHKDFPNYGSDQRQMFDSIMSASNRVMHDYPTLRMMIPVGRAIQIARQTSGNYDLTRDGYHLDKLVGRYIAACTWFETLMGQSVVGNPYHPAAMTDEQALWAQQSAHAAVVATKQ